MHTATPHIGVLAVQGGVAEHATALEAVGARVTLIRAPRHLSGADGERLDAVVLPGGESTTQDTLLRILDLAEPLRQLIAAGLPTLGTCAGLILLAEALDGAAPGQRTLGGLDVTVSRNAWGSQVVSRESAITVDAADFGANATVRGAFIRAPEILQVGPKARVIARENGRIVGATSLVTGAAHPTESTATATATEPAALGSITGIAFHPELSGDFAFHRALAAQAIARR